MSDAVPQKTVEQLCPELRVLLDAELAAGNAVVDCRAGLYGPEAVLVLLKSEFRACPIVPPPGVEYRAVNDPHWWKAEYFHAATKHCLACGF
jgi:hypothetical protein